MDIIEMKNEVEEACYNRDLTRTVKVLALTIPASKTKIRGSEELKLSVMVATLWAKNIASEIETVADLMAAMIQQSNDNDGYPELGTSKAFIDSVDTLKAKVKWDSIDPNFYKNVDFIYTMVKPYVKAMEEGEV